MEQLQITKTTSNVTWKGFQILYIPFQANNSAQSLFFLVYTGRQAVPMLVASYLYMSAFGQTMVYTCVSSLNIFPIL